MSKAPGPGRGGAGVRLRAQELGGGVRDELFGGAVRDCQLAKPGAKYGSACQSIFFATSKDLKNWTRLPFKPPPADDAEVFKYSDGGLNGTTPGYTVGGRWDCIATVPTASASVLRFFFHPPTPLFLHRGSISVLLVLHINVTRFGGLVVEVW